MCWKEEYSGVSNKCKLGDLFWAIWKRKGYQLPDPAANRYYIPDHLLGLLII